jgi:predicted ATPase with chaperone activity
VRVEAAAGPLLDRVDLHIEVPPVKFREITSERTGEISSSQAASLPRTSAASRSVKVSGVAGRYSRASSSATCRSLACACSGKLWAFLKISSAALTSRD